MIVNKPAIFLYTFGADGAIIKEICAGIEEEGVLFEIFEKEGLSLEELSFHAARDSILGSGIGVVGKEAALQLAPLPIGKQAFTLRNASREAYRLLGCNSARAIKKMPFKEI